MFQNLSFFQWNPFWATFIDIWGFFSGHTACGKIEYFSTFQYIFTIGLSFTKINLHAFPLLTQPPRSEESVPWNTFVMFKSQIDNQEEHVGVGYVLNVLKQKHFSNQF